jgi:2-keto-4-pentenoate hydratase/2-oxohepta-3-ene-1,7-dioic acid hydratase in catechol pathway
MLNPGKIVCVGRNYAAHAAELGNEVPKRPLLFLKPPSAVIGDGDVIELPPESARVEHEAEIGVVMGERLRHGDVERAMEAVAAYVPLNDVTARDLQKEDVQFTRAKGFDSFCPIGAPVPAAGVAWRELEIVCRVNGEVRQHGRARDMVFGIPELLVAISAVMTLEPGDVVATGTPEGVGPLRDGDVVEVELVGHSSVRNRVLARRTSPAQTGA